MKRDDASALPTIVRVLGESDAGPLRTLRLEALRDSPDSFLSSYDDEARDPVEATAERLREIADAKDSAVLGAFENGVLVGMLGIIRNRQLKASHRAHLWGMYVAPTSRKHGLGAALIAAAVARLRAAGVEQAHLTVATSAQSARRLYLITGFSVVGMLAEAMKDNGRYIDEELMVLRLTRD